MEIMDDIRNFTEHELEQLTYRILQQIAKSMSLPSNVKKMYLIQLIYAKTHKTEVEVLEIVQRVRYERQLSSQHNNRRKGKKKMHLQAMEVSSSNACMSPPIDLTPTRGSLAYSPEMPRLGPVIKYHPRDPRCESPKNTSDRVLRSYNIRSYKRPNYSLINNSVLELVKAAERASSPKEKETRISIVSHEGRHPRVNVTACCVLKKIRPFMTNHSPRSYLKTDNVTSASIASSSSFTHAQSTSKALVPAKRARALSGITPLPPQPPLQYNYEFVKSVGFRRTDGKLSKINALVQKPAPKIICNIDLDAEDNTSYKNVQVTIQDIINSNIDAQTFTQPRSEYTLTESNMAYCHVPLTDVMPQRMVEGELNSVSVYYHKKIRAEQVRTKKELPALLPVCDKTIPSLLPISLAHNTTSEQQLLPGVSNVYKGTLDLSVSVARNTASEQQLLPKLTNMCHMGDDRDEIRFKEHHHQHRMNDTCKERLEQNGRSTSSDQQLLPKISDVFNKMVDVRDDIPPEDSTVSISLPVPTARNNAILEGLYNYKSDTLTQPLGQVTTTAGTRYVYSYPLTITTAIQHDPAFQAEPAKSCSEPASTIYAGTSDEVARICEFASFGEQDMTLRKYHEALRESNSSASSQLTADEMVEDALELISQDGDYMERIGMDDVRMQCVLCAWAGSKFNLEYHIRKEHATEITRQDKNEWNITYKLGSLVNQLQWLSHACERDSTIYIVSVKYEDPDCLMASFSTITSMSEPEPKMGTLTLYNKVTGEPFTWHGQIMELNHKMPFENDPLHCLKIELSKLELLPNSANIKLHNRSLVLNSPSKVVVGQPALNDIHIIIFVKLHDLEFE